MARASLAKEPRAVAAMFDAIARRYDVANDVLSLGQDRLWRRATVAAVDPRAGERILDLAAGTGTSSAPLARTGAVVVACDFSLGMLARGRAGRAGRAGPPAGVHLAAGDGLALPFADAAFDAVTVSFGLRNMVDLPAALAELERVTRPGGRLVVCEFSQPTWRPFRVVYADYLVQALPWLARRVAADPAAYEYLVETIRAWPDQQGLADRVGAAGWSDVAWRNLSGGIVALHRARRPAANGTVFDTRSL